MGLVKFLEKRIGSPLTFGGLIESIRLCEEISQAELARMLGVSRSHICNIEKNRKAVTPLRAAKFAKILGYSEKQFVGLALQSLVRQSGLKYQVEIKQETA